MEQHITLQTSQNKYKFFITTFNNVDLQIKDFTPMLTASPQMLAQSSQSIDLWVLNGVIIFYHFLVCRIAALPGEQDGGRRLTLPHMVFIFPEK